MSSIYFVALPLLFGFATPLLKKLGKNGVAYASTGMQAVLFLLALNLAATSSWEVEVISINPPLGISFVLNGASLFFVLLFTLLMLLFSLYYMGMRKENPFPDENKFFILVNMLLAASIGLVLSSDIFNIYVFFEIAGISAYILSAYRKTPKALEAGLKYLLTGMVASAFLLFGIALIYIHLGSLNLAVLSGSFSTLPFNMKLLISLLLFIGFGFKVEIFPLNFWVTDVYEGADPLIDSLFSSIVVKAYLFVFFHILYLFMPASPFAPFLLLAGAVSMLAAEIVALKQDNLKRVFAYSSLGQVGLIFAVLSLESRMAVEAGFFIVFAHSVAKMAIFLSITSVVHTYKSEAVSTLKVLHSPMITVTFVLSMLSLLGIPLFAGFVGKFLALKSFSSSGEFLVLGIVLLASLIESIYYFKIAGNLFGKREKGERVYLASSQKAVFSILILLLVAVGTMPWLYSGFLYDASAAMVDTATYANLLTGGLK